MGNRNSCFFSIKKASSLHPHSNINMYEKLIGVYYTSINYAKTYRFRHFDVDLVKQQMKL